MRLDKFVSHATGMPRDVAKRAVRKKSVTVNGETIKSAAQQVSPEDVITLNNRQIELRGPRYIMLHKPAGYVCATEDGDHPIVLDLLEEDPAGLSIAGRLDLDTTGLVLLTDDGQWLHRVISPKRECHKVYEVQLQDPCSPETIEQFAQGILLRGEDKPTLAAVCVALPDNTAEVTLNEGRYHQVKRMFAACGNHVVALHRRQIGAVTLSADLPEGEFRNLTPDEVASFLS
jgi:16S rRNA pseudouridine516 synthase